MAKDGVAVQAEIASAVASFVDPRGEAMNVAATCRGLGISRKTFYRYVARYRAGGVEGFFPRSRRPRSSPTTLPVELEDVLVRIRKQEHDGGWDYGAAAVLLRLEERRDELWPAVRRLPSRSTINRVFDARGLLAKTPQRRPPRKPRRFERSHANALWQFDGFDYVLADGICATVLHLTDDCSRVDLALQAARSENGVDVWAAFCVAAGRYGLPTQLLTDNGTAFSGKRRGWISTFERRLGELSVEPICSSVRHPGTCGKNERAHQRVQKWLEKQPRPATREGLQALLDRYRENYNGRRNSAIGKLTPNERFALGPMAYPAPFETPTHLTRHRVSARGTVCLDQVQVSVGRRHQGNTATVFRTGDYIVVFINDEVVRETTLDHTRIYQGWNR